MHAGHVLFGEALLLEPRAGAGGLGARAHAADEREALAQRPLDHALVELVVVGHGEHRSGARDVLAGEEEVALYAAQTRLDGVLVDEAVAVVAEHDAEAALREQRRHERPDVTSADHQRRGRGDERLEQQIGLAAAAHAELGSEAEGLHLGLGVTAEEPAERAQDRVLDGAAADGADRVEDALLLDQHELLARAGGRGAAAGEDRGHRCAEAAVGRVGRGAQHLGGLRGARHGGLGVAPRRAGRRVVTMPRGVPGHRRQIARGPGEYATRCAS